MWPVRRAHLYRCAGCGLVHRESPDRDDAAAPPASPRRADLLREVLAARRGRGEALIVGRFDAAGPGPAEAAGVTIADAAAPGPGEAGRRFHTVVLAAPLSAAADPAATLDQLRRRLADDGVLVLVEALVDGRAAALPGRSAQGWNLGAAWQFTRKTAHLLLLRHGFDRVWFRQDADGQTVISAAPAAPAAVQRLSVIVPAFNERRTCAELLDRLIAKTLPNLEKEIVIVESNSTDGTREIVQRYRDHPDVRIVLEDRPRGKGHAVRAGLAVATGHLVLIQDADLEYDIEDYESLLQPLLDWQALFVLGSRHSGHWKMRIFNDAPLTAAVFNLGHVFYASLVNVMLGTRMSDPFTMFKVFRRDCLHGLAFEGRRFDFDFEIVMKLVRKGYVPLELPVNYTARSFTEGKKVSFVRDGLTWVGVVLRHGLTPLPPGDRDRFDPAAHGH